MKKIIILSVLVGAVIALLSLPAGASLVPMSWGLPTMTQSASLTAFQKDTATATDNEAAAVAFGSDASDICGSAFGTSFPTITQTSLQSQILNSVKFQNEESDMAFSYPFLSIGGSPIPSLGFL